MSAVNIEDLEPHRLQALGQDRGEPHRPGPMKQPMPMHPRRQPLPEQQRKPGSGDPDAPEKVERILVSPSYRAADKDLDFLCREDMRRIRLLLDYRKPRRDG